MNSLNDLNEVLFKQLEALDNPELTSEELEKQVAKADAVVKVSNVILNNAKLALDAQKHFDEYGTDRTIDIPLLGITNKGLMTENKNLRRRLAAREAF